MVPTRQRARAVALAHAWAGIGAQQRVWPSADVLGMSAWLRREAERATQEPAEGAQRPRLLSATEEWYLWRECTLEATHELELLDGSACATALQRAAELADDYHIRLDPTAGGEAGLLASTRRAFEARCRELGAASVGALLRGRTADFQHAVRVAGFETIPPRLRALTGCAVVHAEPAHPATLLTVADPKEEAARIAAWCGERLRHSSDARLLVLVPGAAGPRERLAALIRQGLDPGSLLDPQGNTEAWVGIESGRPLAAEPLVAHALTTLAWLAGGELDAQELTLWLTAPFWARPQAGPRARLALTVREAALPGASVREFRGLLQLMPVHVRAPARELEAQLIRAGAALGEGSASARAWAERFRAALAASTWPGDADRYSSGQQGLLGWHELLEEFGGLDLSAGSLGRDAALAVLRELALRSPYRAADEDVSVRISPLLADPVIEYDGIWVAGLDAQSFPQPLAPDPFIRLAAQLAAGVPTASPAGRLAQARQLLAAWGRCTTELVVSTPLHDKDLELLPSTLFEEVRRASGEACLWLPARLRREAQTECLSDLAGLPWRTPAPLPRGTRSLELQNQCPFRAYAELRLGSVRAEVHEPGIPARHRGVLLHAALQYLWERLGDSAALQRLSQPELGALIAQSVARARDEMLAPAPPGRRRTRALEGQLDMFTKVPPAVQRECARAEQLIARLCELERQRAPFRVAMTEHALELPLAGARVHLRIDRIDALGSGGYAVLDYKTGRRIVPDWLSERPTPLQLLVYGCALPPEVAALATVSVNAHAVRFDGIARAAGLLPKVPALRSAAGEPAQAWLHQQAAWRELIERLMRAFLAGEAAVDPRPGACAFCHVADICRITEADLGVQEEAAEVAHE